MEAYLKDKAELEMINKSRELVLVMDQYYAEKENKEATEVLTDTHQKRMIWIISLSTLVACMVLIFFVRTKNKRYKAEKKGLYRELQNTGQV